MSELHSSSICLLLIFILHNYSCSPRSGSSTKVAEDNCGRTFIKPILHPKIGQIEPVTPGAWSWTVNICNLGGEGEINCRMSIGLIVGNNLFTRWVLTVVPPDMHPSQLLVVQGAKNYSDLIDPKKVGVYSVRKIHSSVPTQRNDWPVICLLELNEDIYTTNVTQLAPICIPERIEGDEQRFNNTAAWIVGWMNLWKKSNGVSKRLTSFSQSSFSTFAKWITAEFVQFYTYTSYTPRSNSNELLDIVWTRALGAKRQFLLGATLLRADERGRWFVFAMNFFFGRYAIPYQRTEFTCQWMQNVTNMDIQCTPYRN